MYFPLSMYGTGWEKSHHRRGFHILMILFFYSKNFKWNHMNASGKQLHVITFKQINCFLCEYTILK